MTWLDRTPWWLIAGVALALALVPLGDPHLIQKWRMLVGGTLRRPLDWVDLLFHTAPLLLAKTVLFLRKHPARR